MKKKICVYAICKNEIKFVDKWLDSMQEADYIVVLDTGSNDGTFKKLKSDKRVTKIKYKRITPWRFDVARNESMTLVPEDADILVCTDLDEVFDPGWAEHVRDAWENGVTRLHYKYAWSHLETGIPTDIFIYDKIHDRNYKWIFPVHEVLAPIDDNFIERYTDISDKVFLHHYPDKNKERSYYFDLLKLSVEENPNDSHVRMLLAREYYLKDDYQKALDTYLEVLQMPDVESPNKKLVLLESLGRCADLYRELKNYDESIWYCQEFIKEDPTYREPYLLMAYLYNEMRMYTLAEACVLTADKYCTRKYNWVERANTWTYLADDILSLTYFNLGDLDKAIYHAREAIKYLPNDLRLVKNLNVFLSKKLDFYESIIKEVK